MSIHKQIFLGFAIAPVAVRCEALCITITLKRELSGEIVAQLDLGNSLERISSFSFLLESH